jgi:hypothetical protein
MLSRMEVQHMLLHIALFDEDSHYSNSVDPFSKHRVLREVISEDVGTTFQTLQFIKSVESSFRNTDIPCWIVSRAQVMVVTGE